MCRYFVHQLLRESDRERQSERGGSGDWKKMRDERRPTWERKEENERDLQRSRFTGLLGNALWKDWEKNVSIGMQIRPVSGRRGEGLSGLQRQWFAGIHLPSISGPINEELGGEGERGRAVARCRSSYRMGIKKAQAVIHEEFQQSGKQARGVGGGCWNTA